MSIFRVIIYFINVKAVKEAAKVNQIRNSITAGLNSSAGAAWFVKYTASLTFCGTVILISFGSFKR